LSSGQPSRRCSLTPRKRKVLVERRLKDERTTIEDLSTEFGISRECVHQIEVYAFDRIQRAIRKQEIDQKPIGEMA
jgi:RNA polymerase sigma-32 factor